MQFRYFNYALLKARLIVLYICVRACVCVSKMSICVNYLGKSLQIHALSLGRNADAEEWSLKQKK